MMLEPATPTHVGSGGGLGDGWEEPVDLRSRSTSGAGRTQEPVDLRSRVRRPGPIDLRSRVRRPQPIDLSDRSTSGAV